jgi:hypothetical protein
MRKAKLCIGWCLVHFVALPIIIFYLLDRAGHGLIAVSDWAVVRRSWSEFTFRVCERIEMWSGHFDYDEA